MSDPPGRVMHMHPTDLLDFERAWPRHTGAKETAIRGAGLTPARYYTLLHRAASSLEGQAHDAITAHAVTSRLVIRASELQARVG